MRSLGAAFVCLLVVGVVSAAEEIAQNNEAQAVPIPERDASHPIMEDHNMMKEEPAPSPDSGERDASHPIMEDQGMMKEEPAPLPASDERDVSNSESDESKVDSMRETSEDEAEEESEESDDPMEDPRQPTESPEFAEREVMEPDMHAEAEGAAADQDNGEKVAPHSAEGESMEEAPMQNATVDMTVVKSSSNASLESGDEASSDVDQGEGETESPGAEDEASMAEYDEESMPDELEEGVDAEEAVAVGEDDTRMKKKGCKTLSRCKKLHGKCRKKKAGCKKNETPHSTKHAFCGHKACVCCVMEPKKPQCTTQEKCWRLKGTCQSKHKPCAGKLKMGSAFCGGKDCGCCLPEKPQTCKTKYACKHHGGTCINFWKTSCATTLLKGPEYCKGEFCGCCVPNKPTKPGSRS